MTIQQTNWSSYLCINNTSVLTAEWEAFVLFIESVPSSGLGQEISYLHLRLSGCPQPVQTDVKQGLSSANFQFTFHLNIQRHTDVVTALTHTAQCFLYRVPEQRRFTAYKACIRRDTPWQLPWNTTNINICNIVIMRTAEVGTSAASPNTAVSRTLRQWTNNTYTDFLSWLLRKL